MTIIKLFAQKAIEFTVKTADVYPFGIYVNRNGKEAPVDVDLLNVHFEFIPKGNELFLENILPNALTQKFDEINFDSISAVNENLLLQNKKYDLKKLLNKCTKPHLIIETKSGHIYSFSHFPYGSYEKLQLGAIYETQYYDGSIIEIDGLQNLSNKIDFDFYFFKRLLPKINKDSMVRFHLIQSTNNLLAKKGFKAKIYTSNWVNYPPINTKKYFDNIDTTILGVQSYWYHFDFKDTLNRDNFTTFILLKPEAFLNENYIKPLYRIDSSYGDETQSYYKTENYIINGTYLIKNDSYSNYKIFKSVNIKGLNNNTIEYVFWGIYLNDPIDKAAKRLEKYGYKIFKKNNNEIFLSHRGNKLFIHLKGKNNKLKEVLMEYK